MMLEEELDKENVDIVILAVIVIFIITVIVVG